MTAAGIRSLNCDRRRSPRSQASDRVRLPPRGRRIAHDHSALGSSPADPRPPNGLLVANPDTAVSCAVWRAFARYGVGVGAKGTAKGPKASVLESFASPGSCQQP